MEGFPSQSLHKLHRVESDTKMMASGVYLFLMLGFALANQYSNDEYGEYQVFGLDYSRLFSNMEIALLNQSVFLDRLKYGFMSLKATELHFDVQVRVVNGTNEYCPGDHGYEKAFCFSNSTECNWELCSSLDMTYRFDYNPTAAPVVWLSVVHGNLLLITAIFAIIEDVPAEEYFSLTLEVEKLHCHPSMSLMKCVSSELFSWVKLYSEQGSNFQSLDRNQKGSVTFGNNQFSIFGETNEVSFINFGVTEYVFVSFSVALIIAIYFPKFHNQMVSKATRLEHQSLYWGSAVISNFFTYGLIFVGARAFVIYGSYAITPIKSVPIVLCVQEMVVYAILFVGTLIALLRGSDVDIPIPKGALYNLITIPFCCFHCCLMPHGATRKKATKVLILFGFMNFIFHIIMDVISLLFIMFVDQARAQAVTATMLYISSIVFLILFVSFLCYQLFHLLQQKKPHLIFGFFAITIIGFLAVTFILIMYMAIFFKNNPSELNIIATALLPSILLSGGAWYIKKNFQEKLDEPADEQNKTGEQLNEVPQDDMFDNTAVKLPSFL